MRLFNNNDDIKIKRRERVFWKLVSLRFSRSGRNVVWLLFQQHGGAGDDIEFYELVFVGKIITEFFIQSYNPFSLNCIPHTSFIVIF